MRLRVMTCLFCSVTLASVWANTSGASTSDMTPDPRLFGAYAVGTKPALYFSTREEFRPHGSIQVLVKSGDEWVTAGEVREDQFVRSETVDLSRWRTSTPLVVKLVLEAKSKAHVDALTVDGAAPIGLDPRLSRKLAAADNDLVSFGELSGRTFTFAPGSRGALSLAARIEPVVIGTEPIKFPVENTYKPIGPDSSFYTYRVGSHRWSPTIDGSLRGEAPGAPLFRGSMPLGSGHPESPIYGWVGNDDRFLYAALDVTGDNTDDGPTDYGTMFVKTGSGVREFKVTTAQERWGLSGFEYTDTAGWEHKIYELAVPLKEIGADPGTDLKLAFAAYGTLSTYLLFDADPNGVDPDSGKSGTAFTFTVKYRDGAETPPTQSNLWIDLNGDGLQGAGPSGFPGSGIPPWWIAAMAGFLALAAVLSVIRRRLRPALVMAAALALAGCPTFPSQTTQEIYPMTGSGTWDGAYGMVFTATVKLTRDPGTYNFQFLFKDGSGTDITADEGYTTAKTVTID